jgi:hypothetical protein
MTTTWTLPRESKEWVGPVTVTANGVPTTTFSVSLTTGTDRPAGWRAPDVQGGQLGILVGPGTSWPLPPGLYAIWVQIVSSGEAPVLDDVGTIIIT